MLEDEPVPGRARRAWRWFVSGVKWRLHINRPQPQLVMWYRHHEAPALRPIPANITIRTFQPGDEPSMLNLFQRNGQLGEWDDARLQRENATLVPGATVMAWDGPHLAATCGVHDRLHEGQPAWELGWIAADPAYTGMGLGRYCTAAAIRAALDLPTREIFLLTDDHRLPAISVYLDLGLMRNARTRNYRRRWRTIRRQIEEYRANREGLGSGVAR